MHANDSTLAIVELFTGLGAARLDLIKPARLAMGLTTMLTTTGVVQQIRPSAELYF
jgi:hypothetical protein